MRRHPLAHGGGPDPRADPRPVPALEIWSRCREDAAVLRRGERLALRRTACRLALFFPGATSGDWPSADGERPVFQGQPRHLSAAFIIEEGSYATLERRPLHGRGGAWRCAVVAGDNSRWWGGRADGLFITTSGIGALPPAGARRGRLAGDRLGERAARRPRPGGAHRPGGAAHAFAPGGDCAPLGGPSRRSSRLPGEVRSLRDPTRGGLAATLNSGPRRGWGWRRRGAVPVRPRCARPADAGARPPRRL